MSKYFGTACMAVFSIFLIHSSAHAQSLAQKKQLKSWEVDLQSSKEQAGKACGKSFDVEIDSESVFKNVQEDQKEYSMGSYCGNGCLFGVELVCGDDLGKEAVAEKIDKVVCSYQTEDEPKISIDAATKTMNCSYSYRDMQFQAKTKKQLEELL